jgi:hypothetical protein
VSLLPCATSLAPYVCHIYLNNIIIWSTDLETHKKHTEVVLTALRKNSLYCNPRKSQFFLLEVNFLGHHISACGVEPSTSKIECIINWPTPKNATEVHSFLGLVRYVSSIIPHLADHTRILAPSPPNLPTPASLLGWRSVPLHSKQSNCSL